MPRAILCKLLLPACSLLLATTAFAGDRPERVISMAPSITETIYALQAQESLVGVSEYCDYPPAAKDLPTVGGYIDPNYEVILSLKPDLVLVLNNDDLTHKLKQLNLSTASVKNESLDDIFASITTVGELLDRGEEASKLLSSLHRRLDILKKQLSLLSGNTRPKVLVAVSGSLEDQHPTIFVAGQNTIFNDIVEIAGGVNALSSADGYPALSGEGILTLNPDIIIDILSGTPVANNSSRTSRRIWESLPQLAAVQNKRVYSLNDPHLNRPGPRIIDTIEHVSSYLHPSNKKQRSTL